MMKRILSGIIFFLLGIIIIFNLISIVSIKIFHKDYLNIFGYTFFEVQTGSMVPAINVNDVIIVKVTNDIKIDDIITYQENNNFVTHRVESVNDNDIVTKGDANNTSDEPIKRVQVVGKVIKIICGLGIVTKIMKNPITLMIIFVLGTLIIALTSFKEKKVKE